MAECNVGCREADRFSNLSPHFSNGQRTALIALPAASEHQHRELNSHIFPEILGHHGAPWGTIGHHRAPWDNCASGWTLSVSSFATGGHGMNGVESISTRTSHRGGICLLCSRDAMRSLASRSSFEGRVKKTFTRGDWLMKAMLGPAPGHPN